MPFIDARLSEFLDRLASPAPTPGGGSTAALAGALAAGLGRIVCALTAGRPKFASVEPQIRQLADRFTRADGMFRRLMDEDAAAYEVLSAALKLPKADAGAAVSTQPTVSSPGGASNSGGTSARRAEHVANAAQLAATVPLEIAALAASVLHDAEELKRIGNPLLASDAEAATHLARAAQHAAVANVRANLPLMRAEDAEIMRRQIEPLA